ncbi:T6SS immunity protein Tli3 family protein [Enterobacter intestinihominis]
MANRCQAKEPPTQVIYRIEDHRYHELKGRDCEGDPLSYTHQTLPTKRTSSRSRRSPYH